MFTAYYNKQAFELEQWAREELNRVKASRIFKAAQSLEQRYRAGHKAEVDDPYRRPVALPPPRTGSSVQRAL